MTNRHFFLVGALLLAGLLLALPKAQPAAQAQTGERCFSETPYCISGRIREFWEQQGGLSVFGLPISPQQVEEIEGQSIQVQWFERNRLELHPENAPPYDVLLGRLGADVLERQGRNWYAFPKADGPRDGCRYFEATQQNVCGAILGAWRAQGLEQDGIPGSSVEESLGLFGLPLGPVMEEEIDGETYQVQWFERARFELHPENAPPYNVLLGLLGRQIRGDENGGTGPVNPEPAPLTWPTLQVTPVYDGFSAPTHITNAGDGSGRLFVTEQEGTIRVIDDGVVQEAPFLDITERVSAGGERGLLSVAFPPGYADKGYFYVDYTDLNGDTKISRFRVSDNPNIADPASEQVILGIAQPYPNHNGGQLAFGPDGYLYIGMGDGGSGGDPENRAQNLGVLLGKILRIDVESGADPYAIPPNNPFVGNANARDEIWAYGLRNPWRFAFDTATGDLYIADVGQERVEEIDFQPASSNGGENYGWNIMEGGECYEAETCDTSGLTMPIHTYLRVGGNCSVTGGDIYRGDAYPTMQGVYIYADYCSGTFWGLQRGANGWENVELYQGNLSITSFGNDEAGSLYAVDQFNGAVYLISTP
jgi:glucose/arabinose dehydrogenase